MHCHDWQSAPVAWLDHGTAKCAFTIHNLNYGADLIGQVGQASGRHRCGQGQEGEQVHITYTAAFISAAAG